MAGKVKKLLRSNFLTWSHHLEVAALDEDAQSALLNKAAQFTPTGWHPDRDLSYEEWEAVGSGLSRIGAAVNWWIGDWINYGEHEYGQKYTQALELFGEQYEYNMLARMASVSRRVDFSIRILNLSWSHHLEVAALDEDAQSALLNKAAQFNLSVSQLRVWNQS